MSVNSQSCIKYTYATPKLRSSLIETYEKVVATILDDPGLMFCVRGKLCINYVPMDRTVIRHEVDALLALAREIQEA